MIESKLTKALLKEIRARMPYAVVFKHTEQVTSGVPDISVTYRGRTMWVEVKRVLRGFRDTGLQALTMKQLAAVGLAYYVVYDLERDKTFVISGDAPREYMLSGVWQPGFDHAFVARFIAERLEVKE